MKRERDKLDKTLGGIREMTRTPSAVWIVDTNKEHLAVEEARKLRIPIIGILDTNCDPDQVDFPIPGNDDAIRAVGLLTRVVADAVAEGLIARSGAKTGEGAEAGAEEPLAEWERELLRRRRRPGRRRRRPVATPRSPAATEAPAAEADRRRRCRGCHRGARRRGARPRSPPPRPPTEEPAAEARRRGARRRGCHRGAAPSRGCRADASAVVRARSRARGAPPRLRPTAARPDIHETRGSATRHGELHRRRRQEAPGR